MSQERTPTPNSEQSARDWPSLEVAKRDFTFVELWARGAQIERRLEVALRSTPLSETRVTMPCGLCGADIAMNAAPQESGVSDAPNGSSNSSRDRPAVAAPSTVQSATSAISKDAERYRWIRNVAAFTSFGGSFNDAENDVVHGDALDLFVDERMNSSADRGDDHV